MIPKETVFLVVDDIAVMRNITVSLLRSFKAEHVLNAANGKEALQILERHRVDFILSDWNMPVMSGLELLKEVRSNPRTSATPFVMITVDAARDRVSEAIAAGVTDLLVKPYSSGQLMDRVTKAITRQRQLPKPVAEAVASAALPSTQRPTVLVVDDTPANLQLTYELLKDEFRVRTAASGQKALDICYSDNPPDMVLLDVMMPGMDGFDVAQRLREHPNTETLPVIFITAKADPQSRVKGLELGAVDFVGKPIAPEILLPRVRNFMRYVTLQKQLQASCDAMMEAARLREDVEQMTRHDLRGPLSGILNTAQTLAANSALGPDDLRKVGFISESALHLLDMINLSSELFKIETGRYELKAQAVNLDELLDRIVNVASASYVAKGVTVKLEKPCTEEKLLAYGDPTLCHSLFHHLIRNACEGATPHTQVMVELRGGDAIQTAITNDGVLPPSSRENYFKKNANLGKDGIRPGAYSAQLLTEVQGGQIALQVSEQEQRTSLIVHLPRAKA
ncbi:MAG TPA: response regulator [Noviherbaspirillum sp.]